MENKNIKTLEDLTSYCNLHPEERFWQALRNWVEADAVFLESDGESVDTFYWEEKIG